MARLPSPFDTLHSLQQALDRVMSARRFDIVNLEFPYLGHYHLRQAPPGERLPALVVDSHEIAYDLALLWSFRHVKPPEETNSI